MAIDWYIEYINENYKLKNQKKIEEQSKLIMGKITTMLTHIDGFSSFDDYVENIIEIYKIKIVDNKGIIKYNRYVNIIFSIKQIYRSLVLEKILN
jgi:hypothetical protein